MVGVLLVTIVGWMVVDSRLAAWRYAAGTSTNLLTALSRDLERTVESYDLSLLATRRALDLPAVTQVDPVSLQSLLFDGSVEARNMGAMFVMDPAGTITYESGRLVPRQQNNAGRDYFEVHRARDDVGLYISKPYRSQSTGEWSVALSRRVDGPDGSFAGVVAGSIRYSYFTALFAKLDLGAHSGISLFLSDGTVLYRSASPDQDIGRDMHTAAIFTHLRAGQTAPFDAPSAIDGRDRLFAVTQVGTLPLVLSVNTALSTIYADWNRKALLAACLSLVLVIVGAVLVQMVLDQQRHRERAERAMRRSTGMFRAYFENASDALLLINVAKNGTFRVGAINPACARLTGIGEERARGKQLAELFGPETARQTEQRYRACLQAEGPYAYTDTRKLQTGTFHLHTVLSLIRDADGEAATILGSSRDLTEQIRLQAEQHQASKMEAVGRLTAGVAHDFNNALQTIVGGLDVLTAEGMLGRETAEIGQVAQAAAADAARLVHHLLAFSRQQVLQPRRLPVSKLFGGTCKLAASELLGPDMRLAATIEPFTHDIHVDLGQAENCLLNLLLNARDAMPDGGQLVLHARNARPGDARFGTLAEVAHVIVAVQDTGHGMDDDTRARAFEPFFTTKGFGKGAGLGLSMAQGFCRQSGGDIRLLSDSGTGTRVEMWLPAVQAGTQAGDERDLNFATIGHGTGRVLLAQPGAQPQPALAAAMVAAGFEVVTVGSGVDALARLRDRTRYDALVADEAVAERGVAELLDDARALDPGLAVLLLGRPGQDAAPAPKPRLGVCRLAAPAHPAALLDALRETVGARLRDRSVATAERGFCGAAT